MRRERGNERGFARERSSRYRRPRPPARRAPSTRDYQMGSAWRLSSGTTRPTRRNTNGASRAS
jgi:hypothetical protein